MMAPLTSRQNDILRSIGEKSSESERLLLDLTIDGVLPARDIENVCLIINKEYLMEGINSDYSPNEYGLELEGLIDEINRPRLME